MMIASKNVCAVVVTRNRSELLTKCILSLLQQTFPVSRIIVIDNGSIDNTPFLFRDGVFRNENAVDYVRVDGNLGGAGGFHSGINRALESDSGWIWVMDDDGCPDQNALASVMAVTPDENAIHAMAALVNDTGSDELVWPTIICMGKKSGQTINRLGEIDEPVVSVLNAPFIGMMFHRTLIERIGLPDKDFFVSFEDAELCARAWNQAGGVRLVPAAVMRHPRIVRRWVSLGNWKISVIALAPWRRYYDTRNRLVLAKRHFGWRLWTEALPGTLVRWLVTLIVQPGRWDQSVAFARGIFDGLTERLGMRWAPPGS